MGYEFSKKSNDLFSQIHNFCNFVLMKQETAIKLPCWLDRLIFDGLKANYCPSYFDMTNIDDDKVRSLNYIGTYFPRSYAEAYNIFSDYFTTSQSCFISKEELSVFDFGSGTGGEIIGLLTVLDEQFQNLKKVRIVALDGNHNALRIYEKILAEFIKHVDIQIESKTAAIHIEDFYDLQVLDDVVQKQFDIIISFKAICEFVTKQQFEKLNPYEHIASFLLPKLNDNGLMLLEDVTTYNNTSQEWLPKMMDKGLAVAKCRVIAQNNGYNQIYLITHSHKHNDISKVAWRMIKH